MAIEFTCRVVGIAHGDSKLEYDLEIEPVDLDAYPGDGEWIASFEVAKGKNNEDTYSILQERVQEYLQPRVGSVGLNRIEIQGIGKRGPRGEGKQGPRGPGGGKGDKGYKWRGKNKWDAADSYTVDDVVTHDRATYICVKDVTPSSPYPATAAANPEEKEPDYNATLAECDPLSATCLRYWDEISDRPPVNKGQWRKFKQGNSGKAMVYKAGDLVWVDTPRPKRQDKKVVYICVERHTAGDATKPSLTSVTEPNSVWELFFDDSNENELVWSNDWDPNTAYVVGDVVTHEGAIYVCVTEVKAGDGIGVEPDDITGSVDGVGGAERWWKLVTERSARYHKPAKWSRASNQEKNGRDRTDFFRPGEIVKHRNAEWLCLKRHKCNTSQTRSDREPGKPNATLWQSFWANLNGDTDDDLTTTDYRWRGLWSGISGEVWVNDAVFHEDAAYACKTAHTKGVLEPDEDTVNWTEIQQPPVRPCRPFNWQRAVEDTGFKRFRKFNLVKWNNAQWVCLQSHAKGNSPKPGSGAGWANYWMNYTTGEDASTEGSLVFRGEWDGSKEYFLNDLVTRKFDDDMTPAYFRALANHKDATAPESSANWTRDFLTPRFRQKNWTNVNLPIYVGDVVRHEKAQYYCIQEQKGNKVEVTNGAFWVPLAADGEPGKDGAFQYRGEWQVWQAYNLNDVVSMTDHTWSNGDGSSGWFRCVNTISQYWGMEPWQSGGNWAPFASSVRYRRNGINSNRPFLVGDVIKHGKSQWICIQATNDNSPPPNGNWALYGEDGKDGESKSGKSIGGFYVCDGNQNGDAINLKKRGGGVIDNWWNSGLKQGDIPATVNNVTVRLWVKMGKGWGDFDLNYSNQSLGGNPSVNMNYDAWGNKFAFRATAGSENNDDPDLTRWDKYDYTLYRSSFSPENSMWFALTCPNWKDNDSKIAKAKVEILY